MSREIPESRAGWFYYPDHPGDGGSAVRMVMLHARDPRWLVVNGTTREIAGFLGTGGGRDAAAAALVEKYGLDRTQAIQDVDRVVDELLDRGFLAPRTDDTPRRTPSVDSLFLHITDRCNYSCDHCYHAGPGPAADMPLEAACRLIDEVAAAGSRGITISGGEPLLHPRARELVTHAARVMRVRLLTNGSMVDAGWARFLADQGAQVQVSLDGATAETHDGIRSPGSYDAAWRAVEQLQQAGMGEQVNLSTTIMAQNLDQLPDIIDLAGKRGVPLVRFLPLCRRGRAESNWNRVGADVSVTDHEAFYKLVAGEQRNGRCAVGVSCGLSGFLMEVTPEIAPDGIWCPVGRTLVADVDGSAYPCVLMMRDEFRLGNLLHDGVQKCLEHPSLAHVCAALTDRRQRIPECAACHWRNLCQAGCMGQALDHRGTIWGRDDFCTYRGQAYQDAFDGILGREDAR